jgi:hypothetical protein
VAHGLTRRTLALSLCALALAASGCWTRSVKQVVQDKDGLKVILRSETRAGSDVSKGYQHPATISGVRLANVLSRIEIRTAEEDEKGRKPAIDAQLLFDVGDALSGGLAKASPDQEVAVLATRRARRLGIFNDDFLTSFTAYVKNDRLVIVLSRVDWPIPKDGKDDRLPEPNPAKQAMKFRVIPTEGMTNVGPQGVAVDWRASQFKAGSNVSVTPGGKVVRRTILMESVPEDPGARDDESLPVVPANLSPDTLRKLADLEEARRRGELSEAEYANRKSEILRADPGASPARSPASDDEE